jgi:hypothetical protein
MNGTNQIGTQSYGWTQTLPATILLVEDDPAVRGVTREALELGGYRVLTADGPTAAVHIAGGESTTIDLLPPVPHSPDRTQGVSEDSGSSLCAGPQEPQVRADGSQSVKNRFFRHLLRDWRG